MAVQQPRREEAPVLKKRSRRLLHIFACLHACRLKNCLVNRLAFKPPQKCGYTIAENGKFYLYDSKGLPISLSHTLSEQGIRYYHAFTPKRGWQRISLLVVYHTDDFDMPNRLSKHRHPTRNFVIFSHGNSTDMGYMFGTYVNLALRQGVNVIAYDYSGYGLSTGSVGEKQLYSNIEQVYTYLRHELYARPEKIILYGNSLGSVPSSYLASLPHKYPIGGLVLEAPLASAVRLHVGHLQRTPVFDVFTNVEYLKSKQVCPTLIMHGTHDAVIPIQHAMELAYVVEIRHAELMNSGNHKKSPNATSGESFYTTVQGESHEEGRSHEIALHKRPEDYLRTWWVPGANHNNIQSDYTDAYNRTMTTFLEVCDEWRIMRKLLR